MSSLLSLGAVALTAAAPAPASFEDDLAFLRQHTQVIVLGDAPGARIAVVPAWQSRVATSTTGGPAAPSYGWINRELVASRKLQPHMNAFGGEDRIWLGPEGGQYSIFFKQGDPFDLEHWQTPPLVDSEPWAVAEQGPRHAAFRREGSDAEAGPIVTDAYFGKVPADRLVAKDGVVFFKGDGEHRSKIGLSPARATAVLGSWDAQRRVLTIVSYSRPSGAGDYVNSMWEIQKQPYRGGVVNSYNDGPPAPGVKPLGPFYELETSSPAQALAPGERLVHVHRTLHAQGDAAGLDALARSLLGVSIEAIETSLAAPPAR